MTRRLVPKTALVGLVIIIASAQVAFSQEDNQDWERAHLQYELQKVDPWGPFVLNLLLGLGIGSFVQGDTPGGLLVAGGEVVGIGLVIAGAGNPEGGSGLVIGGAALLTAARIAGLIFPFTYANAANEKLRQDLGISVSNVSLNEQGLNIAMGIKI